MHEELSQLRETARRFFARECVPNEMRWREQQPRRWFRRMPHSSEGVLVEKDGIRWKRRGVWYQVEVRKLERNAESGEAADFIWLDEPYAVVKKRQLGTRELREAGLANDA